MKRGNERLSADKNIKLIEKVSEKGAFLVLFPFLSKLHQKRDWKGKEPLEFLRQNLDLREKKSFPFWRIPNGVDFFLENGSAKGKIKMDGWMFTDKLQILESGIVIVKQLVFKFFLIVIYKNKQAKTMPKLFFKTLGGYEG